MALSRSNKKVAKNEERSDQEPYIFPNNLRHRAWMASTDTRKRTHMIEEFQRSQPSICLGAKAVCPPTPFEPLWNNNHFMTSKIDGSCRPRTMNFP